MKRVNAAAFAVALALTLACRRTPEATPPAAPAEVTRVDGGAPIIGSPPPSPPPERSIDLATILDAPEVYAATPAKVIAVFNVAAMRALPSAARLREYVRGIGPGWELLIDKIDWIAWVGPTPGTGHEEVAVVVVRVQDGVALDWNIERMLRPGPTAAEIDLGLSDVRAWRLPGDRHRRAVVRVRDDVALMTREAQAVAAAKAFRTLAPRGFARNDLMLIYGKPVPFEDGVSVEDTRLDIVARADGSASLHGTARCRDAAMAERAATTLRSIIEKAFPPGVKWTVEPGSVTFDLDLTEPVVTALIEALARDAGRLW